MAGCDGVVLTLAPDGKVMRVASAQPSDNVVLVWNIHTTNVFHNPPAAATPGAGMPPAGVDPLHRDGPQRDLRCRQHDPVRLPTVLREPARGRRFRVDTQPDLAPDVINRVNARCAGAIMLANNIVCADAVEAGIAAGDAAAAAMLADRAGDGHPVGQ